MAGTDYSRLVADGVRAWNGCNGDRAPNAGYFRRAPAPMLKGQIHWQRDDPCRFPAPRKYYVAPCFALTHFRQKRKQGSVVQSRDGMHERFPTICILTRSQAAKKALYRKSCLAVLAGTGDAGCAPPTFRPVQVTGHRPIVNKLDPDHAGGRACPVSGGKRRRLEQPMLNRMAIVLG